MEFVTDVNNSCYVDRCPSCEIGVIYFMYSDSGGSRNVRKGGAQVWPNLLLLGCGGPRRQTHSGMPNLRIFIACFSLRTQFFYGRIYGFFRTEFGYYPPPPTLDSRDFARAEWTYSAAPRGLCRLLPEISGFFGIPIGQPCVFWQQSIENWLKIRSLGRRLHP